ncbi:transposase, partial [Acetobacter senegalensis]|uniref:transposase n=1 Tax=Acetobacter senegalensis TaxID=446692 RepID=UPI001EDA8882
ETRLRHEPLLQSSHKRGNHRERPKTKGFFEPSTSDIWADTAYRSKANEAFMEKHGFVSKVHRKKPHLKLMPRHIQRSNARKSVIRSRVEHVFADQKSQTGLFVRTVGITRATMRVGLANIVYNMRRFIFLERISTAT